MLSATTPSGAPAPPHGPAPAALSEPLSEALLAGMVGQSLAGIDIIQDGRFVYVNPRMAEMFGYSVEELIAGVRPEELIAPEDRALVAGNIAVRLEGTVRCDQYIFRGRRKDGSTFDVEVYGSRMEYGGRPAVFGMMLDVTERRRAEEALRASQARKAAVLDASLDACITIDGAGHIIEFNAAAERLFGRTRGHVLGRDMTDLIVPARYRDVHRAGLARLLETGQSRILGERREITGLHADGTEIPVELAIVRSSTDPLLYTGFLRDLSERRRAEQELRASEARFRAFMDHSPAAAWVADADGRLVYHNAAYPRTFCLPPGDPVGRSVFDLFPEGQARRHMADIRAAAAYGSVVEAVERGERTDGSAGEFLTYTFPLPDAAGPGLVGGVAVDVTERQRAEVALRLSEERYRRLFETCPLPMWIYDVRTLRFLAVNDAAVARYGYSRAEFLDLTVADVRPAEDVPALLAALPGPPAAPAQPGRHRTKDGRILDVEISSHALRFDGRDARFVLVHDVTEQRRLEEQVRQSGKLEAIGQLAGGVAHDFNNLLTVVLGFTDVLLTDEDVGPSARELVSEIHRAGERAAGLTRQLLAFSRKQVLQPRVLDLGAVVRELQKLLQRLLGADIEYRSALANDLPPVWADPGQMEQVLMNLAVNARDAMPTGGTLTVETGRAVLTPAAAVGRAGAAPGPYVVLSVADTGCGMDERTQAHVFEPFFTTKGPGRGTGLGLATVYGIVRQSGGFIELQSTVGRGTTFRVWLPALAGPAPAAASEPADAGAGRGAETVLLAEDETAVRDLARLVLSSYGYTVLEAEDGSAAEALARRHRGSIDLLLTDVVMPRLSGRQLADRLTAARPGLRVLYMSGYTDDAVLRHGADEAGRTLLQKPFTPAALARAVRAALDARR